MFLLDMAGIRPSAMEPRTRHCTETGSPPGTCGRYGSARALCASDGLRARILDHTRTSPNCDSPRTKMKCLCVK